MNYIFDFDGTIADSFVAMVAIYNKNIRNNDNPLSADEIQALRGMTSRRAIRSLGVHWWQLPKLLLSGLPDFKALIPTLTSFPGLPETLKTLHERGDKLYIVTSNTRDSVDKFLNLNKVPDYFADIESGAGLFKKAKHIRKIMKKHHMPRKHTVYIGDETRDIQAARLAFIKGVSVTWGFNTREILSKQHPSFIIDKPKELLNIRL
ncbi:MAG: phosphoglycolate phosphatase [Candidatus Saccharibacteria bacterium]|nr:phosphoglycolate phosphatase [Candidatus Saccharibacteria bacterium]